LIWHRAGRRKLPSGSTAGQQRIKWGFFEARVQQLKADVENVESFPHSSREYPFSYIIQSAVNNYYGPSGRAGRLVNEHSDSQNGSVQVKSKNQSDRIAPVT
jgi:hypothetical protein